LSKISSDGSYSNEYTSALPILGIEHYGQGFALRTLNYIDFLNQSYESIGRMAFNAETPLHCEECKFGKSFATLTDKGLYFDTRLTFPKTYSGFTFGLHPRVVALHDSYSVDVYDTRTKTEELFTLMRFPFEKNDLKMNENIACLKHVNNFETMLATDKNIVLMDHRYPNYPLMVWKHYLKSPPKQIRVTSERRSRVIFCAYNNVYNDVIVSGYEGNGVLPPTAINRVHHTAPFALMKENKEHSPRKLIGLDIREESHDSYVICFSTRKGDVYYQTCDIKSSKGECDFQNRDQILEDYLEEVHDSLIEDTHSKAYKSFVRYDLSLFVQELLSESYQTLGKTSRNQIIDNLEKMPMRNHQSLFHIIQEYCEKYKLDVNSHFHDLVQVLTDYFTGTKVFKSEFVENYCEMFRKIKHEMTIQEDENEVRDEFWNLITDETKIKTMRLFLESGETIHYQQMLDSIVASQTLIYNDDEVKDEEEKEEKEAISSLLVSRWKTLLDRDKDVKTQTEAERVALSAPSFFPVVKSQEIVTGKRSRRSSKSEKSEKMERSEKQNQRKVHFEDNNPVSESNIPMTQTDDSSRLFFSQPATSKPNQIKKRTRRSGF
jgi:hypothetical protein